MTWYAGIDLGTTNSAIASFDGETLRLHKSPEQNDVTPSVIFFDRRGNRFVGQRAYDSAAHSPRNAALRFKRLMGSSTPIRIEATGGVLSPEQCSAEILRALFAYVSAQTVEAAIAGTVITVPAAFDQVQKEATMAAARIAAIGPVALMQEPVAAVMSVMRARPEDGRFLVFDLGGGTLDVAIAESTAGRVSLLAHGGIAMCGGRDFDRAVLEGVVAPWLHAEFELPESCLEAGGALERLASWAIERAKIELSSRETTSISLAESEMRLTDEKGRELYLDVPLSRDQFDVVVHPRMVTAVQAAQDALKSAGVTGADIERIVFVGGPTQYAPLRAMVAEGLGIPAALDVNPMTAVAEGAALFAESLDWSTQNRSRKSARASVSPTSGNGVSFAYTARTPGLRGRIVAKCAPSMPPGSEFQVDGIDSGWSSGRMPLGNDASAEVPLAKLGENIFKIFLFMSGTVAPYEERIVILRTAATVESIPASYSVGVEVLEKIGGRPTLAFLVKKGDALPKKGRVALKATESLKAGGTGSINVKLWEGDIATPVTDNRFIGAIRVTGSDLDGGAVAAGDDLECDYEVLDSGNIAITVSVPRIGATITPGRNFYSPQEGQVDLSSASRQVSEEGRTVLDRLNRVADKVDDERLGAARAALERVADLRPENANPEECKEAMDAILQAKRTLADARRTHLEVLRQAELDTLQKFVVEVTERFARPTELQSIRGLFESARRVISRETGDFEIYLDEIKGINHMVLWREDWFVVDRFRGLVDSPYLFVDQAEFQELAQAGAVAVEQADMEKLRQIVARLSSRRIGWASDDEMELTTNVVKG